MTARIVRFPGNPRPTVRRDQRASATIVIMPVIRIERFVDKRRRPCTEQSVRFQPRQ